MRLPNHQSDAARALHQGGSVHMCFHTSVRHFVWVHLRVCVYLCVAFIITVWHIALQVLCHAHRKAIIFHNIVQKSNLSNQKHTKELLSNMSLMKQRPFKIYEPNYNGLSLHLNSKWLHHLLGNCLYLNCGDDALNSLVIKNKEQEDRV